VKKDILEYLWRRFPHHCIVLTDPATLKVIELGVRRAAVHGFRAPEQVCSWVTLMIFFGAYFDEDPLFAWAGETLQNASGATREEAMRLLYGRMNEATNPVLGENSVNYRRALAWVRELEFDEILNDAAGASDSDASLAAWIRTAFPARYASLSAEILQYLAGRARRWARQYELAQGSGAIECVILMTLFSSHVDRDPLRPWVAEVLEDRSFSEPLRKTRALHESLQRTLRRFAMLDRFRS
jgi:hypothetical protein